MNDLLFYSLWVTICSFMFAYIFYNIWRNKKNQGFESKKIDGIKWFSYAIFVWGVSGLWMFGFLYMPVYGLEEALQEQALDKRKFDWVNLSVSAFISSLNTLCIVFAMTSIELKQNRWIKLIKTAEAKYLLWFVLFIIALATIGFGFILKDRGSFGFIEQPKFFTWFFDLVIGGVVLWHLMLIMSRAFKERGMKYMEYVSYAAILLTVTSQLLKIAPAFFISEHFLIRQGYLNAWDLAFSVSFKCALIFLFFILLYSWELKENKEKVKKLKEDIINERKTNKHLLYLEAEKEKLEKELAKQLLKIQKTEERHRKSQKGLQDILSITNPKVSLSCKDGIPKLIITLPHKVVVNYARQTRAFKDLLLLALYRKMGKQVSVYPQDKRIDPGQDGMNAQNIRRIRKEIPAYLFSIIQVPGNGTVHIESPGSDIILDMLTDQELNRLQRKFSEDKSIPENMVSIKILEELRGRHNCT